MPGLRRQPAGMACQQSWPDYDESKTVAATVQMAVQVGGKVRANIVVPTDSDEAAVVASALAEPEDRTHGRGRWTWSSPSWSRAAWST